MLLSTTVSSTLPELGIGQICLRLLCAMLVGLVIGTEREYTNRPAGMRTHILVALGACSVMITGQLIYAQYSTYGASPDPSRLGAQVITGVGFLGAGTILRDGTHVKGLTTAASLWAVACLGLAAGGGYYAVALIGMGFILVTLTIFEVLQHRLLSPHIGGKVYEIETPDVGSGLDAIQRCAKQFRCEIHHMTAQQTGSGFLIGFSGEFAGLRSGKRRKKFFESLAKDPSITSIRVLEEVQGADTL